MLTLCPNAKAILETLVELHGQHRPNLPLAYLVEQTGLCRSTVKTYVKALQAWGLIEVSRETTGLSYTFTVQPKSYLVLQKRHHADHDSVA